MRVISIKIQDENGAVSEIKISGRVSESTGCALEMLPKRKMHEIRRLITRYLRRLC